MQAVGMSEKRRLLTYLLAGVLAICSTGIVFAETRDEFRKKARFGMWQAEAVQKLGKPDAIVDDKESAGVTYYFYYNRTQDPGSDKKDRWASVTFVDGKLVRVDFKRD
jgi:hypothetical protein